MENKNSSIKKGFKGEQKKEYLAPFFWKLFQDVLVNTIKDFI